MLKKLLFFSAGAGLCYWMYCKLKKTEDINEVLFFPDDDFFCYNNAFGVNGCVHAIEECKNVHSMTNSSKLCHYLHAAKSSVDISMFIFSNKDLTRSLSTIIKEKQVKVRILINSTMAKSEPKRIEELRNIGAEVRLAHTDKMFHHKFAIIDRRISLSGSFNWTAQATLGNFDNVIVSSDKNISKPFVEEFDKLWKQFSV